MAKNSVQNDASPSGTRLHFESSSTLGRWEDAPGPYEVCFSTRIGGVSEGPYSSLNLGLLTKDERARVDENRRLVFAAAGAEPHRACWPRQVHGGQVLPAEGRGAEADGLWTDEPGRPLVVVTADCLPIALVRIDGTGPALALLHAGWRGLLAGIVRNAVAVLGQGRLGAVIGPGIGPCCYEVQEDVAGPMRAAFGSDLVTDGRLDLPAAAERALRAAGCERVDHVGSCTACNPERFFSHRRDRGLTGRQGAVAYVT